MVIHSPQILSHVLQHLTSIELFEKEQTLKKVEEISSIHLECMEKIKKINISKPRVLGSIAAFEFNGMDQKYGSSENQKLKNIFRKWFIIKTIR